MNSYSLNAIEAKKSPEAREKFIEESHSFLVINIFKVNYKFVNDQEDVFSVAQMALNEAIDSYDPNSGEFKTYAAVVIKRRIIDYQRSQEKYKKELVSSPKDFTGEFFDADEENDENSAFDLSVSKAASNEAIQIYQDENRKEMLAMEIRDAEILLAQYGFTFYDLTETSPKSEKTKEACKLAIIALLRPGDLYNEMKATGSVPMKELEEACGVKRKILDRHRRYIIASAEILAGDFPLLADYLDFIRKELRK